MMPELPEHIDFDEIHTFQQTGEENFAFVMSFCQQFGFVLKAKIRGDKKCFCLVKEPSIKRIADGVN